MSRRHIEAKLGHEAGQARRLAFRQIQDEAGERGRIDDGVLERALQASPDEPGVERMRASNVRGLAKLPILVAR